MTTRISDEAPHMGRLRDTGVTEVVALVTGDFCKCIVDVTPARKVSMTTIQFRRGTAAEWRAKNPVLATGEPGYESDTGHHKVGDGFTRWLDLPYLVNQAQMAQAFASSGAVGSSEISSIKVLTQAAYDALTPDQHVLYIVVG